MTPTYDRFDIVSAHYAYACDYHDGQSSELYARQCRITNPNGRLRFKPSPSWNGFESLTENGREIYNRLERENGQQETAYVLTDPYELATAGCVNYCGDSNPIDHDGFWYDPNDCDDNGYANCVRIQSFEDRTYVERLTINKPSPVSELQQAVNDCGSLEVYEPTTRVAIEIESCLWYGYSDPSDDGYNQSQWIWIVDDEYDSHSDEQEKLIWDLLNRLVGVDSCS